MDERRSAPSASGMPRYHACDASWQMELLAREQNAVPDGMAGADSGQRIHGELHEPESQDLALSESDMAERCERNRLEVVGEWEADHIGRDGIELKQFKETRLGLTALGTVITVTPETKAKIVFSGQFDGAEIDVGQAGIIWDFKTLMGQHETAQTNLQLLSLAWLAAKRWSLDRVRVALIQPWKGEPTVADYDKGALKDAGNFIERTIHLITQPAVIGATNPGPQCRYCPGRLVCPAVRKEPVDAIQCIAPHTLPAEKPKDVVFARVHEFDNADLAVLLSDPRFKYALWVYEAAKSVAAKRIADGQDVPGYELRDVEGKREITKPLEAWTALAPLLNFKQESFLAACKPSPPALEEQIRIASGPKITAAGKPHKTQMALTGMEAKKTLETALGDLITKKTSKRLCKAGANLEDQNNE
jgi:hypothetical protein